MLNNETKRRIDNCRDILVGKLPDPKSQVEQITIALIYKFMDDMDRESEELGGSPSFFVGDFSRYKWSNVVDTKLSGFERLNLYAEGMDKMNQNTSIPQLFRDIFKNAYLPYRDPETFSLFAKEINGFNYEHSEELGNAFEYLLSIMSSQGDAGQFRTPRHIIDFIVEIVEPKKNETILDPACGTAGFLISAYKYIQKMNEENGITPDEHERLTKSITGYDISPDMVRLSLVNLYLHLFPEPRIYEYDTLTSEERWNENYDVILANPPFMTPKGGIKPHSKFAIKANRSEVLFVDYIMEHINLNGRAGVIVPEGIIFQSANAYKSLRKKLIDDKYLWAVVSLPAGVFNPYSGVKTSILLMDREIAKKTDKILFVKVENDGYDLGAQRRKIDRDDFPKAVEAIRNYKLRINNVIDKLEGKFFEENCIEVEKAKIAENGEYNLSGERYKTTFHHKHEDFPMIEIGEIYDIQYGLSESIPDNMDENGIKIISTAETNIDGKLYLEGIRKIKYKEEYEKFVLKPDTLLFNWRNAPKHVGKTVLFKEENDKYIFASFLLALTKKEKNVENNYVKYMLNKLREDGYFIANSRQAVNQTNFNAELLKKTKIVFPPLSVQKEIVEEIEGYQKIIDGARAVVESYKPRIKIDESWEVVELGEVCEFIDYRGKTPEKSESGIRLITAKNIRKGFIDLEPQEFITNDEYIKWSTRGEILFNDVFITTEAPLGNIGINKFDERIAIAQRIIALRGKDNRINQDYLASFLITENFQKKLENGKSGTTVYGIKASVLKTLLISLPPLEIQQKIVEEIEEEQKLVEANKRLIEIFEGKIKAKIAEVWGE